MKYLEGNIFINFYMFGAAGVLAVILGSFLADKIGVKNTYILSYYMSLVGAFSILFIQMNVLGFKVKA
jgi:Na+/melibiose symporter-like transporter